MKKALINKKYTEKIVIIALFIGIYALSFNQTRFIEPWYDEAYTGVLTQLPIKKYLVAAVFDSNPVLYPILIKLWSILFGNSMLSLRTFSFVMGSIALYILYKFLCTNQNKVIAAATILAIAINPFFNSYMFEARSYMLFSLLFISAYVLFKQKKFKALNLTFVLLVLTHFFGAIYFFIFLMSIYAKKTYSLKEIIKMYKVPLGVVSIYMLPIALASTSSRLVKSAFEWIPRTQPMDILKIFEYFLFGVETKLGIGIREIVFFNHNVLLGILLIILIPAIINFIKNKTYTKYLLEISLVFVPIISIFLLSLIFDLNYFLPRYFMPSFIIVIILLVKMIFDTDLKTYKILTVVTILFSYLNAKSIIVKDGLREVYDINREKTIVVDDIETYLKLRYFSENKANVIFYKPQESTKHSPNDIFNYSTSKTIPVESVKVSNSKNSSMFEGDSDVKISGSYFFVFK